MADRVILVCTVVIATVYLYATTLIPTLEIGDPLGPKAPNCGKGYRALWSEVPAKPV